MDPAIKEAAMEAAYELGKAHEERETGDMAEMGMAVMSMLDELWVAPRLYDNDREDRLTPTEKIRMMARLVKLVKLGFIEFVRTDYKKKVYVTIPCELDIGSDWVIYGRTARIFIDVLRTYLGYSWADHAEHDGIRAVWNSDRRYVLCKVDISKKWRDSRNDKR